METDFIPFAPGRLFWGEQPPLFYLEVLLRTSLVYFYALLMLRWVGARSVGQLSMIELILVIGLGSAVGDVMFYPEVPLFVAFAVITTVVGLNKLLDIVTSRFKYIERKVDGRPILLVRDGLMIARGVAASRLSEGEVEACLRLGGAENMSQVRVAILETSGKVSIFLCEGDDSGKDITIPAHIFPPISQTGGTVG